MVGEVLGGEEETGRQEHGGWGTLEQVPFRNVWQETYGRVSREISTSGLSLDEIGKRREELLLDSNDYEEMEASRQAVLNVKLEQIMQRYPLEKKGRIPLEQKRIEGKYRAFAKDFLRFSGYPEEAVGDMVAAMGGAITKKKKQMAVVEAMNPDVRTLDMDEYSKRLESMSLLAGEIGADGINRLWKECGILNFSNYPASELKWQDKWLQGDERAKKRYSDPENPTVMLLRDGVGDWNGAYGDTDGFEGDRPMLAFEVGKNTVMDLAKCNAAIRQRQMFASTLVVGAHGASSGHEMVFGGTSLKSRKYDRDAKLAWEDPVMANILQAIKPDKYGKRTVIVESCSQGKERGGVTEVVAGVAHEGQPEDVTTSVFASTMSDHLIGSEGTIQPSINKEKGALVGIMTQGEKMKRINYSGDLAVYDEGAYRSMAREYYSPNYSREETEKIIDDILSGRGLSGAPKYGKYEARDVSSDTSIMTRVMEKLRRRRNGGK